ncbi:methionyl-tRNA formyltransferase [Chitinimonas sp. BJB300]|nr:methionyl-tRNA formyltransferase [Chitinimonas sp. BJB300]
MISSAIRLYLTGKKGYLTLVGAVEFIEAGLHVEVIIGRDANVANDYSNDMVTLCIKSKIPYHIYPSEPDSEYDYIIAAGWQRMIRNVNENKIIVFHDSLLPKYRGFAPLVNALLNREAKVGVTALVGASEYDVGDIYHQESISVSYPVSIGEMIDTVSELYASLVKTIILKINSRTLITLPQSHAEASYSLWRDDEDYKITWSQRAVDIEHFINCVGFPYLGATTTVDNQLLRVQSASAVADVHIENRMPGKIIFKTKNGNPVVVCGEGLLQLNSVLTESGEVFKMNKFRTRFK